MMIIIPIRMMMTKIWLIIMIYDDEEYDKDIVDDVEKDEVW